MYDKYLKTFNEISSNLHLLILNVLLSPFWGDVCPQMLRELHL
jgi:hypothetical protein